MPTKASVYKMRTLRYTRGSSFDIPEDIHLLKGDHFDRYDFANEIARGARMGSREVIRALRRAGWYEVKQEGSHKQFKHDTKKGRVTVPFPRRDIPVGTLKSIEKQAGIKLT